MKKIFVSVALLTLTSTALPFAVFAQTTSGTNGTSAVSGNNGTQAAPTVPPAPAAQAQLQNPLAGVNSLGDLFLKIVNFLISFSYIIIAFFLILSGFKFVVAQGSDTELQKAKQMFYYTIIGAAIIVGAQTITTVVQNILTGLQSK